MSIVDVIKRRFQRYGKSESIDMIPRPVDLAYGTRGVSDIAKLPSIPIYTFEFCAQMYTNSDLLRTIIRNITFETFRNGLNIVAKYVKKCVYCGTEYQTGVTNCNVCGSNDFIEPNYTEYNKLEKMLNDVNLNDQSLLEVLQEIDTDVNLFDNAFLSVVKEYNFNDNGEVIGSEVREIIRSPPDRVELIVDKSGRFAHSDNDEFIVFCLDHRDKYHAVKPEDYKERRSKCPICGKQMYPAYYRYKKKSGQQYIYYTNGEMLHIKKFTTGIGYGVSPVFTVAMKLLILLKMDYFVLTAYHLQRPPKMLLFIKMNPETVEKAWKKAMLEAERNPHMIYPFAVEGLKDVKNIVEKVDLSIKPADVDFIQYREELRKSIGAAWGVMPIFTGESGGQGLGNEGIQILVTNRTVKVEQQLFNEKILPWLCKTIGIRDWLIQLVPNEGRDIVARIQREQMRLQIAQQMNALGYKPVAKMTEDGLDFDYFEVTDEGYEAISVGTTGRHISPRRMPRFEGEPEHGRARTEDQRFQGEPTGVRNPKTNVVGTIGDLYGDQGMETRTDTGEEE